jgi:hypothetical protein
MLPVRLYGLFDFVHVVSELIIPLTFVAAFTILKRIGITNANSKSAIIEAITEIFILNTKKYDALKIHIVCGRNFKGDMVSINFRAYLKSD